MANYITMTEMVDFTGIHQDEVGLFDKYIEHAQEEFEGKVWTFDGTETNYKRAQRAVAFLTAYYIRRSKKEVEFAKTDLEEYNRIVKGILGDATPESTTHFHGYMTSITQGDLSD